MSTAPGCVLMTNIPSPEFFAELRTIIKEEVSLNAAKDDSEKLLSVKEACNLPELKISRPTLKKLESIGKVKSIRVGGRIFYRKGELLQSSKLYKKFSHTKTHQNEQSI